MKNPPHPGFSIKENCLAPLGLSITEAAKVLGVTRHTLSRVLNGRADISPEMAIRLEKAGWSSAEFWLRRQTAYNLVQARRLIIEAGQHFPDNGGYWSRVNNMPDAQALAAQHARQQFWTAFA